jgi:hypothetical protein
MNTELAITFGEVTASEIEVMLDASASSGDTVAKDILTKYYSIGGSNSRKFTLTRDEAEYLKLRMFEDAERVAMGVGDAAGRAFEKGASKLERLIKSHYE